MHKRCQSITKKTRQNIRISFQNSPFLRPISKHQNRITLMRMHHHFCMYSVVTPMDRRLWHCHVIGRSKSRVFCMINDNWVSNTIKSMYPIDSWRLDRKCFWLTKTAWAIPHNELHRKSKQNDRNRRSPEFFWRSDKHLIRWIMFLSKLKHVIAWWKRLWSVEWQILEVCPEHFQRVACANTLAPSGLQGH